MNIELDEQDARIICGGLAASHSATSDAISARAGAPYGYSRPRREPVEIDSCIARLDRIERIVNDLGGTLPGYCIPGRKRSIEFWHEQSDIWFAEQALASGAVILP